MRDTKLLAHNMPLLRDDALKIMDALHVGKKPDFASCNLIYATAEVCELAFDVLNTTGVQADWLKLPPRKAIFMYGTPFMQFSEWINPITLYKYSTQPKKYLLEAAKTTDEFAQTVAIYVNQDNHQTMPLLHSTHLREDMEKSQRIIDQPIPGQTPEIEQGIQESRQATDDILNCSLSWYPRLIPNEHQHVIVSCFTPDSSHENDYNFYNESGIKGINQYKLFTDINAIIYALATQPGLVDWTRPQKHKGVHFSKRLKNQTGANCSVNIAALHVAGVSELTEEQINERHESAKRHSRWIVSGFIRNQRYGKDLSKTKQIWIAPHVAGDPNMPLVLKERVTVVRR